MKQIFSLLLIITGINIGIFSQEKIDKFRQLDEILPTPNTYRTASGAPGHQYWQQRADYIINIELNDDNQSIQGQQTVTYYNNSPDILRYIWLQLDQNIWDPQSDAQMINQLSISERMNMITLKQLFYNFDGGFKITEVSDSKNQSLKYTINKTMMRIELPAPLNPGSRFTFNTKWYFNINDRMDIGGRSGYEYFEEDQNYLYTIAQFFPRMVVYSDTDGWQHKQFLGKGEFTLTFGNYEVNITVPGDHLVAATGVLLNMKEVLSKEQLEKYNRATSSFTQPVIIATQEEAIKRESNRTAAKKTWKFKAENVRDFSFASSRKFIWDAMAVKLENGNVSMAMSMYPKEGNPLWEQYSTKAVAHTLKWYSHFTIDYPYPVAWSINADKIGMEYPMISFNFGRCEKDGTYSKQTKYGMIGVIIHEVGHNFFPMIINSDERQWTWMDEGLNTFVQYLTEQQWERNYPSRRGPAQLIVDYMKGEPRNLEPIMTNSESVSQLGMNAYAKPATALNILRETVMGRDLFDYAFKEYSRRWAFKHPTPADFFRTMEDASAVDLDWFWRGWFYTNEYCDQAIADVKIYTINNPDPNVVYENNKLLLNQPLKNISQIRYNEQPNSTYAELDSTLYDFYNKEYDPALLQTMTDEMYNRYINSLSNEERDLVTSGKYFIQITIENIGELVMPIIIKLTFEDDTYEIKRIPAEIWAVHSDKATKTFVSDKNIKEVELDPYLEIADVDRDNNYFPSRKTPTRFELYRSQDRSRPNEMQLQKQRKQ
jgi:hypothetical protein